jgi:CRISPR type III-A-associated protein Csm2
MPQSVADVVSAIKGLQSLTDWKQEQEGQFGLVLCAEILAEQLGKTPDAALDTQVRKFLDALRKLDIAFTRAKAFDRSRVALLKPKLAYAVSRKEELVPLYRVIDAALPKVKDGDDFKFLLDFVEAVLAFYKYQEVSPKG